MAEIRRAGKDITLISLSRGGHTCLEAAERLAGEGVEAEVIDLRALNPLDMSTVLESVKKTGRALTVEESWLTGGWGGEVAARIMEGAFDSLDAPVLRVGGVDVPMPYARELEKAAIPDVDWVVTRVREILPR